MRVIINADDLGRSLEVNNAIFETLSAKLITSSTVFANGPAFNEAVKIISQFPECSFGVHLNITEFRPLSLDDGLGDFLDKDNRFVQSRIRKVKMTPSLSYAIYKEFCAQVERLLSSGIQISHIDSHHHIHTMPNIFPILKRIQKKYGIKRVRISRNIYNDDIKIPVDLLFKKWIYKYILRYYYYPTKTTSAFTDFETFYKKSKLKKLAHNTVEIMVHPGNGFNSSEMILLKSPWFKNVPFPVHLINYNQL